jgi:hypothetical protein
MVSFDIAVTVSNEVKSTQDNQAEAKLIVVSAEVKLGEGKTKTISSVNLSTNRIQFSVPVIYPTMPVPHPGNEK